MKKLILSLIIVCGLHAMLQAQITIAAARAMPLGTAVTVKGLVLNGAELGDVRYIQDNTGNIAAFSTTLLDDVLRGDSIQVTGPLSNYNGLLEISSVTSTTILNSGNPLPAPSDVTCLSGFAEFYEAKLVKVSAALFADAGTFSTAGSGTNYDISDVTGSAQVRVLTATNIDGTPIPEVEVSVTGILSQYAPGGTGGYQLLPRDLTDISTGGNPPVISSALTQTDITTSSFTVNFNTITDGNTIIYYGLTTALGSVFSTPGLTTTHALNLTGLTAGTIYYVKAASVSVTNDTSYSAIAAMATASNSTGQIKIWFNNPVDNSVSTGTNAVYVNGTMDDTIIDILNHVLYSVDIAVYNIDNVNNIISAINDAYARGVDVRVICDSGVSDASYNAIVIGTGKKKKSPPDGSTNVDGAFFGIMHNKFINVDAISTNANDQWVITGSMNYTDDQIKLDKQNIIAIQDQSLSKAYKAEFDEMFSGKFGPDKTNNTPHEFVIGGKRVELYFSPSDEPETHLIEKINTADFDLHMAVFSFTRFSISYAIEDAVNRGVFASGIWDQTDATDSTAVNILEDAMGDKFFNYSGPNLFHHKYVIIDANCPHSDPLVWTGSHNWSSSANSRNDENSIVVHDSTVANIYYQEYTQRYKDEGATEFLTSKCDFVGVDNVIGENTISIYPNPANTWILISNMPENVTSLKIYSINGIMQNIFRNNYSNQIDVSLLVPGLYILAMESESGLQFVKFVKE